MKQETWKDYVVHITFLIALGLLFVVAARLMLGDA